MDEDIFPLKKVIKAKKTYLNKSNAGPKLNMTHNRDREMDNVEKIEPLTTKIAMQFLLEGKLKSKVCRYCLNITPALSELDQIMNIAGSNNMYKVTIRDIVASFHPFKVVDDPNFPNKICQKCLDRALNAYLFTQQCERAERAMLNCFEDIYEKFEKLDPIDRPKKRGRQKLNPNYNKLYAEHDKVIDYAEPIINIVNLSSETGTTEPELKELECKKCWQVLPNLESLLNHEKTHPKSMWYHCRLCGKSFPKISQLKKHNLRVHVQGKETPQANNDFKCGECNHVAENYVQHIQHIEKHKFRNIMEHLIEKRTDRLCVVCLNKGTKMMELDQMVCVHGGHPELTGDKSLYTVLASTLPNNKYKYQELYIPKKAQIMTITKKSSSIKTVQGSDSNKEHFLFSYPIILSTNDIKTDHFYYYVFSDPQSPEDISDVMSSNGIDNAETVQVTYIESIKRNTNTKSCTDKDNNNDETRKTDNEEEQRIDGENISTNVTQKTELVTLKILHIDETQQTKLASQNTPYIAIAAAKNRPNIDIDPEKISNTEAEKTDLASQNRTNIENDAPKTLNIETQKTELGTHNTPYYFNIDAENISNNATQQTVPFTQNKCHIDVKSANNAINNGRDTLTEIIEVNNLDIEPPIKKAKTAIEHNEFNVGEEFMNDSKRNTDRNVKIYEDSINNKQDSYKFVFSKPILIDIDLNETEDNDITNIKVKNINMNTENESKAKTNDNEENWIFKNTGTYQPYNNTVASENCKFCWIFERKGVCVCCKNMKHNSDKKIEDLWQCAFCLTSNSCNRATCHCCDASKATENALRVNFANQNIFKVPIIVNPQENIDTGNTTSVNKPVTTEENIMDENKSLCTRTIEIQGCNEPTYPNYSTPMSMDIETNTIKFNELEMMDVEESPAVLNREQNWNQFAMLNTNLGTNMSNRIIDIGMNVAANVPNITTGFGTNVGANISNIASIAGTNITTDIGTNVGANIQFNIGSGQKTSSRPFKRAIRTIPKAFHK